MRLLARLVLVAVPALWGCAGSQHPASDPNPVSLGSWCEEVTATLCHATAERCAKNAPNFEAGCQQTARESCLGGRDRALSSGRTGDELRRCVKQIGQLACPELGGDKGTLAASCSAKAPAAAAGQP